MTKPTSALARTLATGAEAFLDFLYPPVCLGCGGFLDREEKSVCRACLERLERIREPICRKCGRQLKRRSGQPLNCPDCRSYSYTFDICRSLAVYTGLTETLIHHLKYRGKRSLAPVLGKLMAERLSGLKRYEAVDLIVPVPLHGKRLKDRGYNQSALLAETVGAELGKPVDDGGLARTRNNKPQVDLDGAARWANVAGSFTVGPGRDFRDKTVLVIDDVMTSGATVQGCAAVLLAAGADTVLAFTLARA
jgi:ComF family protein